MDYSDARKRIKERINISKNGCWEWSLKVRKNGYARVTYKQKSFYAHRLSFSAFNEILLDSSDMDVCHKCDNRKCVNPSHLFLGTRRDNMQDAKNKKRLSTGECHSKKIRGEKSGASKLKEAEVVDIIGLLNNGAKQKDLAEKYNLEKSTISAIKNRKIWRHINV